MNSKEPLQQNYIADKPGDTVDYPKYSINLKEIRERQKMCIKGAKRNT